MKKILIMTLATLFGAITLSAQNKEVIDNINKGVPLESSLYWLRYESAYKEMLQKAGSLMKQDLKELRESSEKEILRMDEILSTRDKILGKETKPSKQTKKLQKYFNDPQKAMEYFAKADNIKAQAVSLKEAAMMAEASRGTGKMPAGKLLTFSYTSGNGFAGWSYTLELTRADNKPATLVVKQENRRIHTMEAGKEPQYPTVSVDDSVFVKVYNMIKDGELYNEASYYQPLHDISDGTGWNLHMTFEGTEKYRNSDTFRPVFLSTGGYMAGPEHHEALNNIIKYLGDLYKQLTQKAE